VDMISPRAMGRRMGRWCLTCLVSNKNKIYRSGAIPAGAPMAHSQPGRGIAINESGTVVGQDLSEGNNC
jgi:hypothetical protein